MRNESFELQTSLSRQRRIEQEILLLSSTNQAGGPVVPWTQTYRSKFKIGVHMTLALVSIRCRRTLNYGLTKIIPGNAASTTSETSWTCQERAGKLSSNGYCR